MAPRRTIGTASSYSKPAGWKFKLALPPNWRGRTSSTSLLPRLLDLGGRTAGPLLSTQRKIRDVPASSRAQVSATPPSGMEREPYLVAFVQSSLSAKVRGKIEAG